MQANDCLLPAACYDGDMRKMQRRLWIGCLAWLLYASAMNAQSSSLIQEGETFPSLWFPSMTDGVPQHLEQWKGQKVVVHLFASW